VDGPRRSKIDTVPGEVGVHEIVYGVPTGTLSPNPGLLIGFPDGSPTGVVYAAANEAVDARIAVNEKSILSRLTGVQMVMCVLGYMGDSRVPRQVERLSYANYIATSMTMAITVVG